MKKIAIIDYGVGNIKSLFNALNVMGSMPMLTSDSRHILQADAIVLPGVGSYAYGMKKLLAKKLNETIHAYLDTERPIVGICLGMQLLFSYSEEFGLTQGLGLIKGSVEKFSPQDPVAPLPHIGWETVSFSPNSSYQDFNFKDFFFCHSYEALPTERSDILASSPYGSYEFCSAIKRRQITAFQFHPEKSGQAGLDLLKKSFSSL